MQQYNKPPEKVALALEPVVCLLSKKPEKPNWVDVKKNWLRNPNFVSMIMNFDKDDISPNCKTFIMNNYLKDEKKFDTDKIM